MKPQDLQIGDYIVVPECENFPEEIGKVISIHGEGCIVETKRTTLSIEYGLIKPLPLSPEIFENNGFEPIYDDKTAYKFKQFSDPDVDLQLVLIDMQHLRCSHIYNQVTKKDYNGEVRYVHELQHLIRFFEINIELKL